MSSTLSRLGTRLRSLVERLDGDVQTVYDAAGLAYRPRYTPVVRALMERGPASISEIADHCGLTHSAISQTVALMRRERLLEGVAGSDSRERRMAMTPELEAQLPVLIGIWSATGEAARRLDAELDGALVRAIDAAHEALDRTPFAERIAAVEPPERSAS